VKLGATDFVEPARRLLEKFEDKIQEWDDDDTESG